MILTSQQLKSQQNAIPLPTLWVADFLAANQLAGLFQLSEYGWIKQGNIGPGSHYILADKETDESVVRGLAWKIASLGSSCLVYGCNMPVESLLADESGIYASDLAIQIIEYALPYPDWAERKNTQALTFEQAATIAKLAIALLPEPQKSIELGTLRERCKSSSYDWNKLMGKLEEEFKREIERRSGITVSEDPDERLRENLLALLKETDPIKKARKKAEIASRYGIKIHEIDKILSQLKRQRTTAPVKVYGLDELLALESIELEWIIPSLLPKGETIICAGSPKAGKSLLSIDAAFAIATGESTFLGETCKRGKVLLVCPDSSLASIKNQLRKRGFRPSDKDYIRIIPMWTIDQMDVLEQELEEFRPDVTIIDSLRRINHGSPVSENSPEFADNIYTLKETLGNYGSAGLLIHHTNKNLDAMGVGKIRGNSAIAGAAWGTWVVDHIPKQDPNNKKRLIIDPADPRRILTVFGRDTEGQSINIEFNPENNSWERINGEVESESSTVRERILRILKVNPKGLSGRDIIEYLELTPTTGRGVYTELNRMIEKRLISCQPAPGNKRVNIYLIPNTEQESCIEYPPLPTPTVEIVEYFDESIGVQGLDNTQQDTQKGLNEGSTNQTENQPISVSNPCVETFNPCVESDSSIFNSPGEQKGGEGIAITTTQLNKPLSSSVEPSSLAPFPEQAAYINAQDRAVLLQQEIQPPIDGF
jgi:AAA domain